jgi:arginine:ornithine antiporter/lysine permease
MIGSGIFALPSQMAGSAAPGPLLIGWTVTGFGMLMLAFVFQTLAARKPDVDGGVYGYARAGFGNYLGFTSAWGYWISAWVGNVGYLVLLMSTLGYFVPGLEGGNTAVAIVGASVVLWVVHALTLRGVHNAAFVNTVVTVAKVVPILTFLAIAAVGFKAGVFSADFWGDGAGLGSTMDQVKNSGCSSASRAPRSTPSGPPSAATSDAPPSSASSACWPCCSRSTCCPTA